MKNTVINVENLGKEYVIGSREIGTETFREMLTAAVGAPFRRLKSLSGRATPDERIWALKDVSFEVQHGEVVGVIGRNGAGKSTLLKVLSRITEPTVGRVTIRGRVSSLLEVGTGFHPELTGRENIYLNGAILGMSRAQVSGCFDEIVAFSGVEKFIDTPVKRYSSGMSVRLAFAVAAHLNPEILIVDEVLAVGDTSFRSRCLDRMRETAKSGSTVVFVSHDLTAIEALTSRCVMLQSGSVVTIGETRDVVKHYLAAISNEIGSPKNSTPATDAIFIKRVKVVSDGVSAVALVGSKVQVELEFESSKLWDDVRFDLGIYDHGDRLIAMLDSQSVDSQEIRLFPSRGSICCEIEDIPLMPGRYHINVAILSRGLLLARSVAGAFFTIEARDYFGTGRIPSRGVVLLRSKWAVSTDFKRSQDIAVD